MSATEVILHWDIAILHAVNLLSGHWFTDGFVRYTAGSQILHGTVFVATYWYFWFDGSSRRLTESRRVVLAGVMACLVGIFVSRLLADFLPFRTRPILDPFSGFVPPTDTSGVTWEDWSSFPSDHAAFTFALSLALYTLAPRVSIALSGYSIVAICLPLLYVGAHYPSDLVVGAAIGAFAAWSCQKVVKGKAVNVVLAFAEDHPPWFYFGAFAVTCELAQMFSNVRHTAHALTKVFHRSLFDTTVILGIAAVGVMFGAGVIVSALRRRTRVWTVKKPEDPMTCSRETEPLSGG